MKTPHETRDFRVFLQNELVRRCQTNANYSLRAFARSLKIDNSHLSKILKGSRPVRGDLIDELSVRLGLSLQEIENFKTNAKRRSNIKPVTRAEPEPDYQQLALDSFQVIADWYHYAILELMKLKGFSQEPKWIAKKLGLTVNEINVALERLKRVGLLEVGEEGQWVDCTEGFSTHVLDENFTSYAHKKFQVQVLEKAIHALKELPIEQRDQSSMMMATSSQRIHEAKLKIKKFRRELCQFLEAAPQKDSVYQLSLSLYPLTKGASHEKK